MHVNVHEKGVMETVSMISRIAHSAYCFKRNESLSPNHQFNISNVMFII